MNIYNWQISTWNRLTGLRQRLPHALLLYGQEGIGKSRLAQAFAQSVLCQTPGPEHHACGICPACHWFIQGHHPDYLLVQPESATDEAKEEGGEGKVKGKPSRVIRIEQIRDLQESLSVGSHQSGLRVIVILPAEAMNAVTANALLKCLEEPPPNTLFLLVSHEPGRLLPTVRSRCQNIAIPQPERSAAMQWLTEQGLQDAGAVLAYAAGSPLIALALAKTGEQRAEFARRLADPSQDPVLLADFCQQLEPVTVIGWMQQWAYDLVRSATTGEVRYHKAHSGRVADLVKEIDLRRLMGFVRELGQARALSHHTLNARLFFESIFLSYRRLGTRAGHDKA